MCSIQLCVHKQREGLDNIPVRSLLHKLLVGGDSLTYSERVAFFPPFQEETCWPGLPRRDSAAGAEHTLRGVRPRAQGGVQDGDRSCSKVFGH